MRSTSRGSLKLYDHASMRRRPSRRGRRIRKQASWSCMGRAAAPDGHRARVRDVAMAVQSAADGRSADRDKPGAITGSCPTARAACSNCSASRRRLMIEAVARGGRTSSSSTMPISSRTRGREPVALVAASCCSSILNDSRSHEGRMAVAVAASRCWRGALIVWVVGDRSRLSFTPMERGVLRYDPLSGVSVRRVGWRFAVPAWPSVPSSTFRGRGRALRLAGAPLRQGRRLRVAAAIAP